MTTAAAMTPGDLVREARRLLDTPTRESISGWPRAVALLARMALEEALDAYWREHLKGAEYLDMRAQLNCARIEMPADVAGDLSYAWHGLSRATHHHAYELDPTAEELRSLLTISDRTLAALRAW
jgi:hypothetical protein